MSRPSVVKVGGSLLDWPGLPEALSSYFETRAVGNPILIVGGGRFADAVRDLDARLGLGERRSHALALRALDLSANALAAILPGSEVVEEVAGLGAAWLRRRWPILAPRRFLDEDDRSPDPLPHAWTTTTDSIAARVAVRLGARELVLLKSASAPEGSDRREAARLGLVDPEFPRASEGLEVVTFANLRDPSEPARLLG